jgi:hypothetical protein
MKHPSHSNRTASLAFSPSTAVWSPDAAPERAASWSPIHSSTSPTDMLRCSRMRPSPTSAGPVWLSYDNGTLNADIKLRPTGDEDLDLVVAEIFGGTLEPCPEMIDLQVPAQRDSADKRS